MFAIKILENPCFLNSDFSSPQLNEEPRVCSNHEILTNSETKLDVFFLNAKIWRAIL